MPVVRNPQFYFREVIFEFVELAFLDIGFFDIRCKFTGFDFYLAFRLVHKLGQNPYPRVGAAVAHLPVLHSQQNLRLSCLFIDLGR